MSATFARPIPLIPWSKRTASASLSRCVGGLIPRWWSKTIKDVKMATFNARAETVETRSFFRDAFKRTRCLIPMSGYYEWQDTSRSGNCERDVAHMFD